MIKYLQSEVDRITKSLDKIYVISFVKDFEPVLRVEHVSSFNINYDNNSYTIRTKENGWIRYEPDSFFVTSKMASSIQDSGKEFAWTTNGSLARECYNNFRNRFYKECN